MPHQTSNDALIRWYYTLLYYTSTGTPEKEHFRDVPYQDPDDLPEPTILGETRAELDEFEPNTTERLEEEEEQKEQNEQNEQNEQKEQKEQKEQEEREEQEEQKEQEEQEEQEEQWRELEEGDSEKQEAKEKEKQTKKKEMEENLFLGGGLNQSRIIELIWKAMVWTAL